MTGFRFSPEESRKLWADKYTFFWYNSPQIFGWEQKDFDAQAEKFHRSGITVAVTFSVTHFRRNFIPYRAVILEALRKLCAACHKYGIKVVEHHSCGLGYLPVNREEWEKLDYYFKIHDSKVSDFPGFKEHLMSDYPVGGAPVSTMRQISGKTGKWASNLYYVGDAVCYNNPDYRQAYHAYVDDLKATGIDALLADDMQYFELGNACTCPHCRAKFKAATGYELPEPERWGEFFEHFDDPAFLAWVRFRSDSVREFQHDLRAHYRKIGLDDHWVNYRSSLLGRDTTANAFYSCREFWSNTFQENCLSQVIRVCWPFFYCETLSQYAVDGVKNAPPMSLFYPTKFDLYYFSWALAQSWGQIPFLCPEGRNMTAEDARFNQFEAAHRELFRQTKKCADLAFLLSRETYDCTAEFSRTGTFVLHGFMQAAYLDNLQCSALNEDDAPEVFAAHRCIAAVAVSRVTDALLERLQNYVGQGGKLLIFGDFALNQPEKKRAGLLAMPNVFRDGSELDPGLWQQDMWLGRMYEQGNPVPGAAPRNRVAELRATYGSRLRAQLPEKPVVAACPEGYQATLYRSSEAPGTVVLHLVRVAGMLPLHQEPVSHDDDLPAFADGAAPYPEALTVRLNLPGITAAVLHSPERSDAVDVPAAYENGVLKVEIPGGTFAGYAVIALQERA